ncbi:hypothetical protein N0V90_008816 [Kalmusia sp. IMI 367209]|nr:hypothetical protein N0V90_008816 [Kalmusia sp. IMI 367209]
MDHWGDPWADDADTSTITTTIKSPAKLQVASPRAPGTPAFAPKPIVLNGFLDDAQWGSNEEEGFSAWAASPGRQKEIAAVNGAAHESAWDEGLGIRHESDEHAEGNEWGRIEEDGGVNGVDGLVEETSDSATTIQPDENLARTSVEGAELAQRDDASTRSSTTSVEEERAAEKLAQTLNQDPEKADHVEDTSAQQGGLEQEVEDDFGEFEDEIAQEAVEFEAEETSTREHTGREPQYEGASEVQAANLKSSTSASEGSFSKFVLDPKLLAELFPPAKDSANLEEPPDGPVSSTSTRKAWYRLTRKQTMREFNSGSADDNYVRVTWKTSHIRSEANKTVARWASEDRLAGRGPGARASFFWDSPAPSEKRASLHARKKSSVSVSNPVRPVSQIAQPLSTGVPAAFDWSSPSSAAHATPDILGMRSTSSPVTAKHSAVTKLQRQGGRAASVDLTPRPREPASHRRTSTTTDFQNGRVSVENPSKPVPIQAPPDEHFDPWASAASSSPVALAPAPVNEPFDPWASLGALDTSPSPEQDNAALINNDDDDDWGEMVESPAVSTVHTPIAEFSEPPTRNNTLSTPSTTPVSVRSSPFQPLAPSSGSKHASPIVRLKGTVSPTSALFKPNALVPTDTVETIGPGILKPRNRSRESTPEKSKSVPVQMPTMDEVLSQDSAKEAEKEAESDTNRSNITTSQPGPSLTPEDGPHPDLSCQLHLRPPNHNKNNNNRNHPNLLGRRRRLLLFESSVPAPTPPAPPPQQPTHPPQTLDHLRRAAPSEPPQHPSPAPRPPAHPAGQAAAHGRHHIGAAPQGRRGRPRARHRRWLA